MEVTNRVIPNQDQIKGFMAPGSGGPIYMVNLLRFKDKAEYEDGRKTDLTGAQAYGLYSEAVTKLLVKFGGAGMFSAAVSRLAIGEVEDLWDKVAIAMYPSRAAMMDMMRSEEMREIGVHRTAGLAGQLNIETVDAAGSWLGTDGV
jgi:uncharacterized protein (DUF1330 family)